MPGVGKPQPMRTMRRQDDGAPEKISPIQSFNTEFWAPEMIYPNQRINTEFGALKSTPNFLMSSEQDYLISGCPAPSPSPAPRHATTTTTRPCRTFTPRVHGSSRHSKIDKFIERLDAACEALPTPLVGSASGPPPSLAAATNPKCSSSTQDRRHPHRKRHQEVPNGVVKEVKFADEVIEIGDPEESFSSERSVLEVREPAKDMASENSGGGGARVSRAVRFDYRKRRSDFVKAATVLQSTYRGYKVRRGQPLKYLLVISSVKEKLEELRQQFDAWKIAAWFPTDLTERTAMTETVMELLLQLDSLQGVPVVVREFRKNVARDVIKFQEEVDGFLCLNSKHGVLFDLTRPEGKVAQGDSNPKPCKAVRNIVVQESNFIESLRDNNPKACRVRHDNGGRTEEVKSGTMTLSDVTSQIGSDFQCKIIEDPHGCSGQNFVLWSPLDGQIERVGVEEKRSLEKALESVTDLKKCVVSTSNVGTHAPPDRKRKSLGVRFGIASFGNRSCGKEHLSTAADEGRHAPPAGSSSCTSTCVESWRKDVHRPPDVSSWEFTGNCQKTDDSKCTVSINKQRSLDIPKDCRIANVYGNLAEDHDIRHPQTLAEPDYSLQGKWEGEFPSDLHCGNLFEIHKSCPSVERTPALRFEHTHEKDVDLHTLENGATHRDLCDDDLGCNQTKLHTLPSLVENVSVKDAREGTIQHKSCTDMGNTQALTFETTPENDEDLRSPEEVVNSKNLYDDDYRHNQRKLQALPSHVKHMSAKDIRVGTIEPLRASDKRDGEMSSPVPVSELECPSKNKFRCFGRGSYPDSSARVREGNRMGISQDMPHGLDSKEGDLCSVVFANSVGQVQKSGSEPIEVGQSENSENAPMPIPSTSILSDNIREQIDGECGSEYGLCGSDDLETISSCSNCAACPADYLGEPWDCESGNCEQMPHQPYALKGLVGELDEVFSERKGEDTSCLAPGYWREKLWRDYTTSEFQPSLVATITSQPNFEREVEVEREDDSCESFKTFKSDEGQCLGETAQNLLVETKMADPHEEQNPEIKESTNLETLACTSQFLGEEGTAASGSNAFASHGDEKNSLLSELVEDNKRLKELLKEVMKWNTVQANAMITLNDRLELVESKK